VFIASRRVQVTVAFITIITTVVLTTPVRLTIRKHSNYYLKGVANFATARDLYVFLGITSFLQVGYHRATNPVH